jgi:hypothetical protein
MAMGNNFQVIAVSMDVTVSRHDWLAVFGTDPYGSVPEWLENHSYIGVDVRLAGSGKLPNRTAFPADSAEALRWSSVRVVLDVTVDADQWSARWGLAPSVGVGPHVVAELAGHPVMRERVFGTVAYVPDSSGRLGGRL